ncbi:MAG: multiheme c-type cytochrome [Planctomycetaceae bacterium]
MASGKLFWRGLGGVCGALGLLLLGFVILRRERTPTDIASKPATSDQRQQPTSEDREFLGSAACGNCHSEIAEAYRQHPMGRSLAFAHQASEIENFEVTEFSPPGARCYRIERTGEAVRHHEVLLDDDGSEVFDQAEEVRYAMGSGKRGRAYLIEHDGMLFKSPVAWFSPQHEWGLSPGYPPNNHKRFERRITEGCINCHVGRLAVDRSATDKYLTPVVVEHSIGCERCHGPGREHAAAHEAGLSESVANARIVNPARLDASRRNAICAECHLHGKATVVRSGQRVFDFRPGQLLEENRIVFVTPPEAAGKSANALSQVEQMEISVCFQKSAGRLGCTSCHDPHQLPSAESRVEYYRAKCLACHETRGCGIPSSERLAREPADSCIACHMPAALHVGNILHVSFSDHRILRHPPTESDADKTSASNKVEFAVFGGADQRLPKRELDRARAFLLLGGVDSQTPTTADARRAEQLLMSAYQAQPDDVDVLENLGAACQIQGRAIDAERWWMEALKVNPRHEAVLQHLALLTFDQKRLRPARDYLERFIEVNPWHGHMHGRLAGVLGTLGDWQKSVASGERALELNPTLIPIHDWLARAYRQTGNSAEATRHRQMFLKLQRRLPNADPPSPHSSP